MIAGHMIVRSMALGVGLAMDAFTVSIANGIKEVDMRRSRMAFMACTYAFFQFLMPLIGWVCVHTILETFKALEGSIPWIALILLLYIGGKMLIEGIKGSRQRGEDLQSGDAADRRPSDHVRIGFATLILQGIATSIDALSVGFAIADYPWSMALTEALIIGIVTFGICIGGLMIGKRFGTRLSDKAQILGGVILIAIGLEIFVRGVL